MSYFLLPKTLIRQEKKKAKRLKDKPILIAAFKRLKDKPERKLSEAIVKLVDRKWQNKELSQMKKQND
jgi:hypothetical protein